MKISSSKFHQFIKILLHYYYKISLNFYYILYNVILELLQFYYKFYTILLQNFITVCCNFVTMIFQIFYYNFITMLLQFYHLLGAQLFPYLKTQQYVNSPDINFSNIFYSMFSLYRIATIEGWYFLLADCSRLMQSNFVCYSVEDYNDYQEYGQNGCGSLWSYPFFFSFYIIILLIFNLLVGIMINISGVIRRYEESSINIYQLGDIRNLWAEYDSKGYGFIDYKDFWTFSSRIALILGVKIEELLDYETKKRFLKILNLKVYEDSRNNNIFCLNFHEVVLSLSRIAVMIKMKNISKYSL